MSTEPNIALTAWSDRAGCGAKAGPLVVDSILEVLRAAKHSALTDVLVGIDAADDAVVYRMHDVTDLVVTVDFISPIVDDAYAFGAIAAANALSDIYAMGGTPLFALALVALPAELLEKALRQVLSGAADKVAEAGAAILGGHTTICEDPQFGLAVVGRGSAPSMIMKSAGSVGDYLYVTKPLGTGVVVTAAKFGEAASTDVQAAVSSMSELNDRASKAARLANVGCGTDLTGFGLVGHSLELSRASNVKIEIRLSDVPLLPGALKYAYSGTVTGTRYSIGSRSPRRTIRKRPGRTSTVALAKGRRDAKRVGR